jgi:NAD(P)-dependent dehydrogenase (short-subunit alcohol dehydrogenase family)
MHLGWNDIHSLIRPGDNTSRQRNGMGTQVGKLDGRTAIVTGGSSGIGLATAKAFIAEGARVAIVGRTQARIDAALGELGSGAIGIQTDVGSRDDLDHLVEEARCHLGQVDIFVVNAGVNALAPFGDVKEDDFDRLFRINTKGVFFSVQKALPILRDGASIILVGSIAGSMAMDGHAVYAGTKGAVRAFARNWAKDLLPRGMRVNVLTPGPVRTQMVDSLGLSAGQLAGLDQAVVDLVPMGRWGRAEEVARAAVFLASDDSSFMTGSELFVDGGLAQL